MSTLVSVGQEGKEHSRWNLSTGKYKRNSFCAKGKGTKRKSVVNWLLAMNIIIMYSFSLFVNGKRNGISTGRA